MHALSLFRILHRRSGTRSARTSVRGSDRTTGRALASLSRAATPQEFLLCAVVYPPSSSARASAGGRHIRQDNIVFCPQSKPTEEGVGIMTRATTWRQCIELFNIASPNYRIILIGVLLVRQMAELHGLHHAV